MAEQKFSETLFEALDIIINKRLQSVQKDKTILCVIEDASKANEGEYVVSNASARFVAYSENTSYKNGQNVWVLIPEGDYNNEKQIISKHAGDSNTPYIYVDPMETYADMTGPIFVNMLSTRHGLIANYSEPLSLFTGDEDEFQPLPNVENYTRMGIKADFQTDFGSADVIGGSYGLAFLIETTKKIASADQEKDNSQEKMVHFYIPVQCDTADMWGNPYAYNIPFTQSFCFDINQEEYGVPTGILGFFYQNSDFITSSGMLPYKISGEYTEDEDGVLVDPNIFVENIEISFGYSMDEVSDDTVYLFTKNALTYTVNDDLCKKTMQVRCIYVSDDITRYAINSWNDFKNKINPDNDNYDATFAALNPSLRWYRYVRQEGVSDAIAGDFWEEIERDPDLEDNLFEYTVNDLKDLEDERFKVVLCYEPNEEDNTTKRWASQNEYIHSDPLIFMNSDNPYDASRDLEQALRLAPKGIPNGVFNLYEASYNANNNLINSADKATPRYMEATFYSVIKKQQMMKEVTRLAWYIPKNNTMITAPSRGRGYNPDTQWLFTANDDWDKRDANDNLLYPGLSDEEKILFAKRINDYYIIVNKDVKAQNSDSVILTYYIEPTLIKHYTNNTIYASAYYYQRNYEGNNAHYELTFGSRGTNGTNYTLLLDMAEEMVGDVAYAHPMAWTAGNTASMRLHAQLYDADDKELTATYKWRLWGAQGNGDDGQDYIITTVPSTGIIYECIASYDGATYTGYLIVPVRNNRQWIAMEGPSVVRYGSSGTGPMYYNKKYGLLAINGNIDYTNTVEIKSTAEIHPDAWPYYPKIENKTLKPTAMYLRNMQYNTLYVDIGNGVWRNPLLIIVDPYGNQLLNTWDGKLTIDKDNNTIMSAVMGAGKKEDNNTFTGLLLGDLPKVENENRTGLLGYEHGEQAYGIFDDGTMFLGKSSRAQLKFNGTEGLIQNAGYDYGHGIKIDFDGGIDTTPGNKKKVVSASTNDQHPYIDIKDTNGAQVYLSTDGTAASPYLKVKSPNATGGKDLLHIESASYYLQTENYKDATSSAAGTGLKIDLANGILNSYNKLTINGASGSTIHFGDTTNYTELGYDETNGGYLTSTGKLTLEGGTFGENNGIYLSTENKKGKVTDITKDNWRLAIGSNFGVDAEGKMCASAGAIGGWTINAGELASGSTHLYSQNQDSPTTIQGGQNKSDWRININNVFGVDSSGNLYASAANLTDITVDAANINGTLTADQINTDNLKVKAANITGSLTYNQMPFTATTVNILTGVTPSYKTVKTSFGVGDNDAYILKIYGLNKLTFSRKTLTVLASTDTGDLVQDISLTFEREYRPGGCFAKGTKILMADYSYKNIENLYKGDKVISYDMNTKQFVVGVINKAYVHHHTPALNKIVLQNNETLILTPGHPLLTPNGWKSLDIKNSFYEHGVQASLLRVGDYLFDQNKKLIKVVDIQKIIIDNNYDSYNAEVFKYHTFIANNIIAHNAKVPDLPI